MLVSALKIKYFNDRYAPPPAWRSGEIRPHNMITIPFRDGLKKDWRDTDGEVWLYPLAAKGGDVLRPTRHGTVEQIKNELGVEIFISGVFIDIDDEPAHSEKRHSEKAFYEAVEQRLEPFKGLGGFFIYRTLRGMRAGFIYQEPVSIEVGQAAQKEIYAKVEELLSDYEPAGVDRACLNLDRGQAAPFINKRGARVPDEIPQLFIHEEDLPSETVKALADMWAERLKSAAHSTKAADRGTVQSGRSDSKNKKESSANPQNTKPQNSKSRTMIPSSLDNLDRTELYNLSRSAFWSFARWIEHDELRRSILSALDEHLMDGARTEKEPSWLDRWIEDYNANNPLSIEQAKADAAPPEPKHIDGHNELLPIQRIFERGDDLEVAEAILATMGAEPAPLWHGDSVRRYDALKGIWTPYNKHALRRIGMSAVGAVEQTAKGDHRPFKISNNRIKAAIEMIQSLTGAGEKSPFDTAPAGVVIGEHFITVKNNALSVQKKAPHWYAIHKLDYDIPPAVIEYWESNGDAGQAPKLPETFIYTYLQRSLDRDPEQGETEEAVGQEIGAKIITIGEWLGLALLGLCTREATALVAHGAGSNGKSVLTSLVADLFGPERTAHLPPQLMGERFSRAQLFGAAVNVVSEMPESDLLASDTLKAVISGDKIEVEKKHQDPFAFIPRAAHIFAANTLPSSRDRSWGLWRRLVPIQFNRIFNRNDRDPDLKDKLLAESDLIVTWALDLAREYLERGGYLFEDEINTWRQSWREETDALTAFISTQCEICSIDDGTELKSLWTSFKHWAEDVGQSGAAKTSLNQFSRNISNQQGIDKKRIGKHRKTMINLKLKAGHEPSAWSMSK